MAPDNGGRLLVIFPHTQRAPYMPTYVRRFSSTNNEAGFGSVHKLCDNGRLLFPDTEQESCNLFCKAGAFHTFVGLSARRPHKKRRRPFLQALL